jgi:hypothetical protein
LYTIDKKKNDVYVFADTLYSDDPSIFEGKLDEFAKFIMIKLSKDIDFWDKELFPLKISFNPLSVTFKPNIVISYNLQIFYKVNFQIDITRKTVKELFLKSIEEMINKELERYKDLIVFL